MKINSAVEQILPEMQKYFNLNYRDLIMEISRFEAYLQNLQSKETQLLMDSKTSWDDKYLQIQSARAQIKTISSLLVVRKAIWSMGQMSVDELKKDTPDDVSEVKKITKKKLHESCFVSESRPLLPILVVKFILEYSAGDYNTLLKHARILLFQESLHVPKKEDAVSIGPMGFFIFTHIVKMFETAFAQPLHYYHLSTLENLPGKLFFSSLIKYYLLSDQVSLKDSMDIKLEHTDIEKYQFQLQPIKYPKVFFEELELMLLIQEEKESYDLCLMSVNTEPEMGKVYLKEINKKIAYTAITAKGETLTDIQTEIKAPEPFDLSKLVLLKGVILEVTSKAGHTHTQKGLFRYLNSFIEEGPNHLFMKKLLNLSQKEEKTEISEYHLSAFIKIQLQEWLIPRWLGFVEKTYAINKTKIDLFGELTFALKAIPDIELKDLEYYIVYIKYLCFLISWQQILSRVEKPEYNPLNATFKACLVLNSFQPFNVKSSLEKFFELPSVAPYKTHCYQPYASLHINVEAIALINSWRKKLGKFLKLKLQTGASSSSSNSSSSYSSSSSSASSSSSSASSLAPLHAVAGRKQRSSGDSSVSADKILLV